MTSRGLLLTAIVASVLASCSALHVNVARPHGVARTLPRVRPVVAAESTEAKGDVDMVPEGELTPELQAQIKENELNDPLMVAAGGDSDFVRWYRYEQAKEEYLKENPVDVLGNAFETLKGPLSSLAIIFAGFYAIPIVRGLADGAREGNVIGALQENLSNPGASVKLPF